MIYGKNMKLKKIWRIKINYKGAKMKKLFIITLLTLLVLTGCGKSKYVITSGLDKTTIEVNGVEDNTAVESSSITLNSNKTVNIDSQLDKGQLKIDFCSAINTADADEMENYVVTDVVKTIVVNPGDNIQFDLGADTYILQIVSVGSTNGKVIITY